MSHKEGAGRVCFFCGYVFVPHGDDEFCQSLQHFGIVNLETIASSIPRQVNADQCGIILWYRRLLHQVSPDHGAIREAMQEDHEATRLWSCSIADIVQLEAVAKGIEVVFEAR